MTESRDPNTGEKKAAAPLKLEFLDGDTMGFCDAETGICTVPNSAGKMDQQLLQAKPESDPNARHRSKDNSGSSGS